MRPNGSSAGPSQGGALKGPAGELAASAAQTLSTALRNAFLIAGSSGTVCDKLSLLLRLAGAHGIAPSSLSSPLEAN